MEVCCSFKSLSGGICGFDTRDRGHGDRVVPISLEDITNHLLAWSFSGPQNEIDLLLCRASIFKMPDSVQSMTICPQHRGKLGTGWKKASSRCRVPAKISKHDISKRLLVIGDFLKKTRNLFSKKLEYLFKQDQVYLDFEIFHFQKLLIYMVFVIIVRIITIYYF